MVKDRRASETPDEVQPSTKDAEADDGADAEAEADIEARWLVVDTGFGRYLGKMVGVIYPPEVRKVEQQPVVGEPLTGGPELVLENVIRFEIVNVPTRQGIAVQAVPSSPIPWMPLFAHESRIKLPLYRILWYDYVDEEAVAAMRSELLAATGGPRAVGG